MFMDVSLIVLFLYFFDITTSRRKKYLHIITILPGTVSLILILVFIKDLYYINGAITSYSMGKSVYVAYASVIVYFLMTAVIPTIVLLGIYIQFENYSLIKLHRYNRDMIAGVANLVETRDDSTGGHIKRTEMYVQIILNEMRKDKKYNSVLTS